MYRCITVDVDMDEFDTDDLIDELQTRGRYFELETRKNDFGASEILRSLYEKRRLGQDYQEELDALIWRELGRIL